MPERLYWRRRSSALAPLSRRAFLCRSGAAGLFGACLCNGAALAQQAELPFREVADGIHVRYGLQEQMTSENGGAIANIGFIVGEESVAVIDTGTTRQQGEALLRAVGAITDLPISHVISTHVHLDHCFGAAAFTGTGARVVGHHRLPGSLAERGGFYLEQIRALSPAFGDTEIVAPDMTVDERKDIDLGGRILTLTAWPAAHTDSDLTVLDARTGLLWASDLLFVERIPVVDGSLLGWLGVMNGLKAPGVRSIMPGHGPLTDGADALERQKQYLADLRDDVRAAMDDGLDISETVAALADSPRQKWLLQDETHARNITTAYAELEWE